MKGMYPLTVRISGLPYSGKTVLAEKIFKLLEAEGHFDVRFYDEMQPSRPHGLLVRQSADQTTPRPLCNIYCSEDFARLPL